MKIFFLPQEVVYMPLKMQLLSNFQNQRYEKTTFSPTGMRLFSIPAPC